MWGNLFGFYELLALTCQVNRWYIFCWWNLRKSSLIAIYAVLSGNLFCCNLRTFCVEISLLPKFCPWRKNDKYNVWINYSVGCWSFVFGRYPIFFAVLSWCFYLFWLSLYDLTNFVLKPQFLVVFVLNFLLLSQHFCPTKICLGWWWWGLSNCLSGAFYEIPQRLGEIKDGKNFI